MCGAKIFVAMNMIILILRKTLLVQMKNSFPTRSNVLFETNSASFDILVIRLLEVFVLLCIPWATHKLEMLF